MVRVSVSRYWPWWGSPPYRGGTPWGPSHTSRMRRDDRRAGGSRSSENKEVLICDWLTLIILSSDWCTKRFWFVWLDIWPRTLFSRLIWIIIAGRRMFKIQFSCRLITFDICTRVQNRVPRSAPTELGSSSLREDEEDRVIISWQMSLSSWHRTSSSKINLKLDWDSIRSSMN